MPVEYSDADDHDAEHTDGELAEESPPPRMVLIGSAMMDALGPRGQSCSTATRLAP